MLLCLVIIPCRSLGCGFRKLGKLAFPQVQCHCFAFLGHCLTVWAASLRPPVVAPMLGKIIGGPSRFELDWNVGLLRAMSWEVTGPEDPTVLYFHGCKLIANRWSLWVTVPSTPSLPSWIQWSFAGTSIVQIWTWSGIVLAMPSSNTDMDQKNRKWLVPSSLWQNDRL